MYHRDEDLKSIAAEGYLRSTAFSMRCLSFRLLPIIVTPILRPFRRPFKSLTIPRRHDIVKSYRKIDPRPNPLNGHPRLYMRQQRRRPRAASRPGCMDRGHLPRGARVKLPHRGNGNARRFAGVIRHNEGRQSFLPQSEWNHGFFPPLCLKGTGAFIFPSKNKSERMHTP